MEQECSCCGWCDCHKPEWPEGETCDCTRPRTPKDEVKALTMFEHYQESLKFLREAEEAIDQAHSCMVDGKLMGISVKIPSSQYASVEDLSNWTAALVKEVETADCEDCNHPISQHDNPKSGCCFAVHNGQYYEACGCRWGQTK